MNEVTTAPSTSRFMVQFVLILVGLLSFVAALAALIFEYVFSTKGLDPRAQELVSIDPLLHVAEVSGLIVALTAAAVLVALKVISGKRRS